MSLFPHGVAANVRRESSFHRPIIRGERRKTYPTNPLDRSARVHNRTELASNGLLLPRFNGTFKVSEKAVMHIIGREIQDTNGAPFCEFYGNIAHRAGVSISSVERALRKAVELGIIIVCSGGKQRSGRSKPVTIFATEDWKAHLKLMAWRSVEKAGNPRSYERHRRHQKSFNTGTQLNQDIDSTLVSTSTLRAKEPEKPPCLPPLRPGFVRLVVKAGQLPAIATCLSLSVSSLVQGPGELFDEEGAFPPPQGRFGPRPGESPVPRRAFVGEASGT